MKPETLSLVLPHPSSLPMLSIKLKITSTTQEEEEVAEFNDKQQILKADLKDALDDKTNASKETIELDCDHKKYLKEKKEVFRKHKQICSELKAVKAEKEDIVKKK